MDRHRRGVRRILSLFALIALAIPAPLARAQSVLPPLTPAEAREVRAAITSMKADSRGPYLRIRWFCADGSVQPPAGTPCAERGGGVQYAEFNEQAKRLAQLHINVGTILQPLSFDALFDAEYDHFRLKELVVNDYFVRIDDGWILRRARYYRGARQIEDEERKARAFLERLLSDKDWTARNFFLAVQLVASLPHAALDDEQSLLRVRSLAKEVVDLDSAFFPLRIKIHSFPSREDLAAVDRYLTTRAHSPEVRTKLTALRDELRRQQDTRRSIGLLAAYRQRLPAALAQEVLELQRSYESGDLGAAFSQIAALGPTLRSFVVGSSDGATNLTVLDLIRRLHEQAFVIAQDLEAQRSMPMSRNRRLEFLSQHFAIAHSFGFLSPRELGALDDEIARIRRHARPSALEYRAALSYLARSLDWSLATARGTFGPVTQRYLEFEPLTSGFYDDIVRGSTLLPLSLELARLSADADRLLGASHHVLGRNVSHGLRGLNPGVAMRVLEILPPDNTHWELEGTKIYVLPETTPELRPPAGVLTLDAGNLLSHVQLLARNLGIPNASIASANLPLLQDHHGKEIFYAVSPLGRVVIKDPAELTALERRLLDEGREAKRSRVRLNTSRLRLDRTDPIRLSDLRAKDSGVIVGPKAANLGQLGALFPGHVSAGVALPFGLFYEHVNRPYESDVTVLRILEAAYAQAEAMRASGRDETAIDEYMFAQLARVRKDIVELDWIPETREAIVRAIRAAFGEDLSGGVFVRSDTNVEDLPQFSGAGLNLTVPHQRNLDGVLASIKRVWTSPFSERAYLWRKQIIANQGQIYPSVLLLESIHSEKSGVLITSGLQAGGPEDLTIATAEGVGGAVEGEDAETILVDRTGAVKLLSQAKSPTRRALLNTGSGGAHFVPAARPEYLLKRDEIDQLQRLVRQWQQAQSGGGTGKIWDIEFGFTEGKLWLFQIRPFVRFRSSDLLGRLAELDREVLSRALRRISLDDQT